MGRRRPRRRSAARREDLKNTARFAAKLGVKTVDGFTGSSIWKAVAMFPPASDEFIAARLPGLRRPLEPDPRRVRRGRRALRPRGAPVRDRVRLLDRQGRARRDRAPQELRVQLRPVALRLAAAGLRRLRARLRRPHLPRAREGIDHEPRRPQRRARLAPALGRPASRLDVRLDRPRRRAVGAAVPRPQRDRLRGSDERRVGGRRDGPADRCAEALAFVRKLAEITPPAAAFDAAFSTK